jgi:molybdopterin molybdotransferase
MIDVTEALDLFDKHISPLESERLAVTHALRRVAARKTASKINLPPFAQSAMDGFAVRAADVDEASEKSPVRLTRVGEVAAGDTGRLPDVRKGQTVRVFTGGRIPAGADAVVRQERTRSEGDGVSFVEPVEPGHDIRAVGEELDKGTTLIEPGQRLDERHVGVLSMCGHAEVDVHRQPAITLLISGDEIVSPGIELRVGEVYDANTPFLASWLRLRGYSNVEVVALEDDRRAVKKALQNALEQSDLVVSTGGVSVGDYDFFQDVATEIGMETIFWKISQKPGKPLLFARGNGAAFLGIPGNPGAVFVSAYVYLRRVLDLFEGVATPGPQMHAGVLSSVVRQSARRLSWTGCTLSHSDDGRTLLEPVRGHRMSQLYRADAIARIPAGEGELAAGEMVQWFGLGD